MGCQSPISNPEGQYIDPELRELALKHVRFESVKLDKMIESVNIFGRN